MSTTFGARIQPLLALFTRSLREDARSRQAYWARAGLALLILLILVVIGFTTRWIGAPGRYFFTSLVSLQLLTISVAGLSFFASAITEEKEELTLGLLRMTNLNPLSILLGKSTSRLCSVFLLLLAQFPFTVVAITLGGISLGQILAAYCSMAAYVFLLGNIALLGSVLARRTTGAVVFTVFVGCVLVFAGSLVTSLHDFLVKHFAFTVLEGTAESLTALSPLNRLAQILTTGFSGRPVGWQVIGNVLLGVVFFLLAWAAFDRFCEPSGAEGGPASATGKWRVRLGKSRRPARPTKDPIVWKDFHYLCGGRRGMILRLVGYGSVALIELWRFFTRGDAGSASVGISFSGMPLVFSIDAGFMAARLFRSELNDQTWATLAILPFEIRQIAYRKLRALALAASPGALCLLLSTVISWSMMLSAGGARGIYALGQTFLSLGNTVLFFHAVVWFSLFLKRGALPIGYLAAHFFTTFLMAVCMALAAISSVRFFSGGTDYILLVFTFIAFVALLLSFFLHRDSLRRLAVLPGQS